MTNSVVSFLIRQYKFWTNYANKLTFDQEKNKRLSWGGMRWSEGVDDGQSPGEIKFVCALVHSRKRLIRQDELTA